MDMRSVYLAAAGAATLLTPLVGLPGVAAGAPLARQDVPAPLRPWVDWPLRGHEHETCPFEDGDVNARDCAWPPPSTPPGPGCRMTGGACPRMPWNQAAPWCSKSADGANRTRPPTR